MIPARLPDRVVPRLVSLLPVGALLALASCNSDTPVTEPRAVSRIDASLVPAPGKGANEASGFYPLAEGNRWHYRSRSHNRFEPNDGSPPFDETVSGIEEHLQEGTETISGHEYRIERQTTDEDIGGGTLTYWIRARQDGDGLFEADVDITTPPAALRRMAPASVRRGGASWQRAWDRLEARRALIRGAVLGGVDFEPRSTGALLDNEITRLLYPLRPNQSWTIREDPLFRSTVEGKDQLTLPAGRFDAWRFLITIEGEGPNDVIHAWYSRCGLVRLAYHIEADWVDDGSEVIGRVIGDYDLSLDDIDLVDRTSCEGHGESGCLDVPFTGITETDPDGVLIGAVDPADWGCGSVSSGPSITAPASLQSGPVPPPPTLLCFDPAAPNPASTETRFSFSVPSAGAATLVIHAMDRGRGARATVPVRHLFDSTLAPGSYAIIWDLRDDNGGRLAAGIYRAILTVGGVSLCGDIQVD